ncbi:MAG: DUF4294 domain-containing protein [Bacteroidota bacterium]
MKLLSTFSFFLLLGQLLAQTGTTVIDGQTFTYTIDECGDTLIIADLGEMSVSSPEAFDSEDDYKLYRRYRYYAQKVYPYATEAVQLFREVQYMTQNMSRRERRRYVRRLQRELKEDFEDPLKKMSKTQGRVLIRMIEREIGEPIYFLIKELRGGLTARYWATLAGLYGHKLKHGYTEGEDPILDLVLRDYNLEYELPQDYTPEEDSDETVEEEVDAAEQEDGQ